MAIQIIKERHTEVEEYKVVFFQLKNDYAGNGLEFDADENGNVKFNPEYEKIQRDNYEFGLKSGKFEAPQVLTRRHSYRVPTLAKCHCGAEIYLQDEYMGACECPECGRWYSISGQELKNPKYWGDVDYEY